MVVLLNNPFETMQNTFKRLFILDALGALLSSFLLGIVLVHFESFFGIPTMVLYVLAVIPLFFAIYDICCYFWTKSSVFLKGIAVMNTLYCLLSIALAFVHADSLTRFGWIYIGVEIIVVLVLASIQFRLAKSLSKRTT